MGEKAVGLEIFIHFDEVEVAARIFARTASAGLAVADDARTGGKQTGLRKRLQCKNHARGISPGVGHQTSLTNFAGIEFGNAVDSFRKPFAMGRAQLIPGGERYHFTDAKCYAA